MIKKVLSMVLACLMVFSIGASMVACSESSDKKGESASPLAAPELKVDFTVKDDFKMGFIFLHDENSTYDKNFINAVDAVKKALNLKDEQVIKKTNIPESVACYDAAVELVKAGCKMIFADSFGHESFMIQAAKEFPNVSFVFVDGYPITEEAGVDGSPVLKNVAGIAFKEEQCGYLAGYAVVKEGFTKLGFTGGGGGTNPACCRYGYGFVQGADAAAKELGVKVDMNYSWQYGASFSASPELQTMVSGWYEAGTEVVFACGGSMFASVAAAAGAADGKVVGVDVDQSTESDTVITSALKGIGEAAQQALTAAYGSDWANYGGKLTTLGAAEGAVGLPTDTWSLKNWTVDQYKAMFEKIVKGEISIDNDFTKLASTDHVTLNLVK